MSDGFNLFSGEPANPQASELLSLKILKDANKEAFDGLAKEETKWLSVALGLLRRDKFLELTMGGRGIRPAMKLAGVLKQKAEQKHLEQRLDPVISNMVAGKFSQKGWEGLGPVYDASYLGFGKDGNVTVQTKPSSENIFGKDDYSGFAGQKNAFGAFYEK